MRKQGGPVVQVRYGPEDNGNGCCEGKLSIGTEEIGLVAVVESSSFHHLACWYQVSPIQWHVFENKHDSTTNCIALIE